jgi:pyruvate,water dikinase
VAFTLDPTNGDRSQVAIDAAWGFGEAVVAGEVTPDNFRIDKVMLDITKRIISAKTQEYVLTDHDTVEKVDTDPERALQPCLTDAEIKAIAKLAKTAERHYGCPQDIEWAVDVDLPEGENVILLQSRPETVWSKKGPTPVVAPGTNTGDFMASIVSTLMSPLYTKTDDGS